MTIHSEKVVFLSQLKAHKQNKNLFGAENLNIDSRSFQEGKICYKMILFFCKLTLHNAQETYICCHWAVILSFIRYKQFLS